MSLKSISHAPTPILGSDGKPRPDRHFLITVINDFEDGKWRYDAFRNYIWDNVQQTALSADERNALIGKHHSALTAAALNLRLTDADKIGSGSEIAEIVLYGIMSQHFKALPVVPKIFYKQNSQDNAKGSDSVHITVHGDTFLLWFGESKFYSSIEDSRLNEVIKSVAASLESSKLKKENSIICNVSDLDHIDITPTLRKTIKETLSNRDSIDPLKKIIQIPILLLHECTITASCAKLTDAYTNEIKNFHLERAASYFAKQIKSLELKIFDYWEITFHLIILPVPKKDEIVKDFIEIAKQYRGGK